MTADLVRVENAPLAPMRLVEWAEEATAANMLAKSLCKTPFAGSFKGDEFGATAAILRGAEVGLTPVTSLAAFDLIQGQPAPKAITLRALVQSAGHDLEIVETTEEKSVARYRRAGRDWQTCEFSMTDARLLGLLTKDNWKKQPKTMLEARVTSKAARLVAADVILGIGYSAEELRDGDVAPVAPTRPAVTAAEILAAKKPVETPEEIAAEAATDQGDEFCPGCGADEIHDPGTCPAGAA